MEADAIAGYAVNSDGSVTFINSDIPLGTLIAVASARFPAISFNKIEVYAEYQQMKYGRVSLREIKAPELLYDTIENVAHCHPSALYTLAQIIELAQAFPTHEFNKVRINVDGGLGPLNYIFLRVL